MAPFSPKKVTPIVEQLMKLLNVEVVPVVIRVEVEPTAKHASCFYNVEEKIQRDGGKIHYGWAVWQHSHIIEAEHHAVWEDGEGNLLDITPQKENYDSVMFIPDNSNVYNGQMGKPNVRLNITSNKLIDDFIVYSNTIDSLYGMATRIDSQQLSLPDQIVNAINSLEKCKSSVLQFYASGNNHESMCFCNSARTYHLCHGQGVSELPVQLIAKAKLLVAKN